MKLATGHPKRYVAAYLIFELWKREYICNTSGEKKNKSLVGRRQLRWPLSYLLATLLAANYQAEYRASENSMQLLHILSKGRLGNTIDRGLRNLQLCVCSSAFRMQCIMATITGAWQNAKKICDLEILCSILLSSNETFHMIVCLWYPNLNFEPVLQHFCLQQIIRGSL